MPNYTQGENVALLISDLKDKAIIPARSLFTDWAVWTPEVFDELREAYVNNPDESGDPFEDKLRRQLAHVSDEARVLFAELLLLNLVIIGNVGPKRKFELIRVPLDMTGPPVVEIPEAVVQVVEQGGVLNGGQGMNQYRWQALVFLVEWGRALSARPEAERAAAFADSEAVEQCVYELTPVESRAMQRSLCYLFDPRGHEPIVSQDHLKRITRHFADRIPPRLGEARMQRQASAIRTAIAAEREAPDWDFYHDRDEWLKPASPISETVPVTASDEGVNDQDVVEDVSAISFPRGLASSLFIADEWLEDLRRAWSAKRQLVLQGPPGTGKTYLARRLAKAATGSEEQVTIVQFHPAYTYEDFFEGFRPIADEDGQARFALQSGPLRDLAERAAGDPGRPHVLVIDEINRGNLAKIFGELYFLLEYRDDQVSLMYSKKPFALPPNLYIIATMNTSDRSIALVDAAMRRRFAFLTLSPAEEPTRGLLERWTKADPSHRPADAPALLRALNEEIGDPERMVGPSYLMQDAAAHPGGIERIWSTEILPLLSESFYGEDDVEERFGLRAIRKTLNVAAHDGDIDREEGGA